MNHNYLFLGGLFLTTALLLFAQVTDSDPVASAPVDTITYSKSDYFQSGSLSSSVHSFDDNYFAPIPLEHGQGAAKVTLGDKLFHDPRLSANDSVACASCHILALGGDDGRSVSVGVFGRQGQLNAPTVFNTRFNLAQFWDGRAATLEDQVHGPVVNPVEMGANWGEVLKKLWADRGLRKEFKQIYPDGLTIESVVDAIATYERSLITPNSDFDRYLRGDQAALSVEARMGLERFKSFGCVGCHQGVNLGGNMYQKFGVFEPDYDSGDGDERWLGRFEVTGEEQDRHVFKVPSLRNVAVTAPYFHDGLVNKLDEAVRMMGEKQLGRELSDEDVLYLVSFLHSLTGEWQGSKLGGS